MIWADTNCGPSLDTGSGQGREVRGGQDHRTCHPQWRVQCLIRLGSHLHYTHARERMTPSPSLSTLFDFDSVTYFLLSTVPWAFLVVSFPASHVMCWGLEGTWSRKASAGHCRQLPSPLSLCTWVPVALSSLGPCCAHSTGRGRLQTLFALCPIDLSPSSELGAILSGRMGTGEGPPGRQVPDLWTMGILQMPRTHGIISGVSNLAFPPVQFLQSLRLRLLRQSS